MPYPLSFYFIKASLKLRENLLCYWGNLFNPNSSPKNRQDLNLKLDWINRRLELAFRHYLYSMPLNWQKENGLILGQLVIRELPGLTRQCYVVNREMERAAREYFVCIFTFCFEALIMKKQNPSTSLKGNEMQYLQEFGADIKNNFKQYFDEAASLYDRCPFN